MARNRTKECHWMQSSGKECTLPDVEQRVRAQGMSRVDGPALLERPAGHTYRGDVDHCRSGNVCKHILGDRKIRAVTVVRTEHAATPTRSYLFQYQYDALRRSEPRRSSPGCPGASAPSTVPRQGNLEQPFLWGKVNKYLSFFTVKPTAAKAEISST